MKIFQAGLLTFICVSCSETPSRRDAGANDSTTTDARENDGPVSESRPPDAPQPCAVDIDGDGHCPPADCDDEDPLVHQDQTELCGNALDDNCNGEIDESCVAKKIYYVDKGSSDCADSHPGTDINAPWCSVSKANDTLSSGETVFIRAGTYTSDYIQPKNSGTSDDARIIYSCYEDEAVLFEGTDFAIRLDGKRYISVIGLKFKDCKRNVVLSASSHNNIGFCEFDNPAGPSTWAGSRVSDNSTYNRFYRCVFSRWGKQDHYGGGYQDSGANLDFGSDTKVDDSDHNLVTHCTFFHGGHHILGVYSSFNVVSHNTFHNEEWFPCHRSEAGGLCGNRNIVLNSSQRGNIRNVIEHNKIAYAGVPPDQVSSAGLSIRTKHNIIRRNEFTFCDSAGVTLSADGSVDNDASDNHIYHNVFFKNGFLLVDDWGPRKSALMLARWVDDASHNAMIDVAIKNNIFFENNLHDIYYYYVDEAEQIAADNWLTADGDPLFTATDGAAGPFDFDANDFQLQPNSPCLDNGGFLTTTTSAEKQGTKIAVQDAGYFTDGHGLVSGDLIQLQGQTTTAMITAIDYDANTITVDKPLDWEAGTGVALPFDGSKPDQGAYERWSAAK